MKTEIEQYEEWINSGFTMKEFDKAETLWLIGPGLFIGLALLGLAAYCQFVLKVVS